MRGGAFDPPALPPQFWQRPDVKSALAARDIGALFRLLRDKAGLSQIRIGTAVEMSQGCRRHVNTDPGVASEN